MGVESSHNKADAAKQLGRLAPAESMGSEWVQSMLRAGRKEAGPLLGAAGPWGALVHGDFPAPFLVLKGVYPYSNEFHPEMNFLQSEGPNQSSSGLYFGIFVN